jgi:hypothetical protein
MTHSCAANSIAFIHLFYILYNFVYCYILLCIVWRVEVYVSRNHLQNPELGETTEAKCRNAGQPQVALHAPVQEYVFRKRGNMRGAGFGCACAKIKAYGLNN